MEASLGTAPDMPVMPGEPGEFGVSDVPVAPGVPGATDVPDIAADVPCVPAAAADAECAGADAGAHASADKQEAVRFDAQRLAALLPVPAFDANKYSRGTVNLVAGSGRYPGAACLAAAAAQRMGAGYTRVITEATNVSIVQAYRASLVVRSWADLSPADLVPSSSGRPCAYVLGCGFDGESETAGRLLTSLLGKIEAPVLVDGGGLGSVATVKGKRLVQHRQMMGLATVLTPHAGEASRLAFTARIPEWSSVPPATQARLLAKSYGAVVVLKGPDTYISDGTVTALVGCGTPALAKAGTGDVLAGMIGALLAQKLVPLDAAVLGATLHAQAGVAAAARYTEICATPEDVVEAIPQAVRAVAASAEAEEADAPGEAVRLVATGRARHA